MYRYKGWGSLHQERGNWRGFATMNLSLFVSKVKQSGSKQLSRALQSQPPEHPTHALSTSCYSSKISPKRKQRN